MSPAYGYAHDAEGHLIKVRQGTTTISTYTYNALGQMVELIWVSANRVRDLACASPLLAWIGDDRPSADGS